MKFETDLIELIQRTKDIMSIRFTKPKGFDYQPGQFIFINLGSGESEMTKHLTISSSPTEAFLEITKKLTGHPFANALAALKGIMYCLKDLSETSHSMEKTKRLGCSPGE